MEKLSKKFISLFLVIFMLFTSLNVNIIKAEDDNDEIPLDYEVIENDNKRIASKLNQVDLNEGNTNLRKGKVRVSIVLDGEAPVDKGLVKADDAAVIGLREALKKQQDEITTIINKNVLDGEKLDVVWNLTLAANVISANVGYDKIEEIKKIKGVKDVFVENLYLPHAVRESDDPNMSTATEMTSVQFAWAAGYTGAGSKIAIVDTGLDVDHISFSPKAFDFAIQEIESDEGRDVELLTKKDVDRLWSSLNASYFHDTNNSYVNSKIPFGFNYCDADFDISHLNDSQGEHGSHVASIAVANKYIYSKEDGSISLDNAIKSVKTQGNAPDAQVLVMKVFGKNGGAYDSDYFAAIEDAIVLGADAVNLSLGSSQVGFSYNTFYQDTIDGLTETNIVWANSAGNSGSWADNTPNSYLYSEDISMASGGIPATYASSLSVASVDNKGFTGNYIEYNDNIIFYNENLNYGNESIVTLAGEHDFVYIDGVGTEEEFEKVKDILEGKIAICSRGTTSFFEKANAAIKNGAIATIIVNNQPGTIAMNLTGYSYSNPVVSLTTNDGNILKQDGQEDEIDGLRYWTGTLTVADEIKVQDSDPDYYVMSDFSSYGVTGSLMMKPEITAPGGNIYAANGLNRTEDGAIVGGHDLYENLSGTSMASPQIAGLVGVMAEYIRENNMDEIASRLGITRRALIQSLLMSTAKPLIEEDSTSYYSILKQGAGLVDVEAASNSNIVILMDNATVNGVSKMDTSYFKDGKVKAELGDDPDRSGRYTVEFTLNNITDEERYFDLSGDFFTQDLFEDGGMQFLDTWTARLSSDITWYLNGELLVDEEVTYDFNDDNDGVYDDKDAKAILDYVVGIRDSIGDLEYADLDNDGSITTHDAYLALKLVNKAAAIVPANGKAKIKADIILSDDIDSYDVNGNYVEGYLFVKEKDSLEGEIGIEHSIPVLGYYGSWGEAKVIDTGSYIDYQYNLEQRLPYMSAANALDKEAMNSKAQTFLAYHAASDVNYTLGGNPLGAQFDEGIYHEDRNAINSKNSLVGAKYSLIRNIVSSRYELLDEDGSVIESRTNRGSIASAYYNASQAKWLNTDTSSTFGYKLSDLKEGDNLKLLFYGAVEYFKNGGDFDYENINPSMSLGFKIDNTAPEIDQIIGKRNPITKTVINEETKEEEKVESSQIIVACRVSDNEYVAGIFIYDENNNLVLQSGSSKTDKTGDIDIEEYAVAVDGDDISDHLTIEVWDYAANVKTVRVNLNKDEVNGPISVELDQDSVKEVVGNSVQLTATVNPWGTEDQEVIWSSSDETIATVNENGVVKGLKVGKVTITATAHADSNAKAECVVDFVTFDRNLNALIWDMEGNVYLSSFNTAELPNYNALSPALDDELVSTAYGVDGTLYSATDDGISVLYTINEDTYEINRVGKSNIYYSDIASAPSMGNNILMGVYRTYAVIIDTNTGGYIGAFNLTNFTGGNELVGIAYEEQYEHPSYGMTDWYFFLDEEGNLYNCGFLPYQGGYSRFNPTEMGSLGVKPDVSYYQSLYYDGTDLYFSNYSYQDDTVSLYFVEDLYKDGSVYKLGSFEYNVWPVSGLYNDNIKELININDHSDAMIDTSAVLETDIPLQENSVEKKVDEQLPVEEEVLEETVNEENVEEVVNETTIEEVIVEEETNEEEVLVEEESLEEVVEENADEEIIADGTLNSVVNYHRNNVVNRNNSTADVDSSVVTITITAEDVLTNGLYELAYDTNSLTLKSTNSNQQYHAFNTNKEGLIVFGFISQENVDKDSVIATIKFTKKDKGETTIELTTKEKNDNFNESSEYFVIDEKILVNSLEVSPKELTLAVGKSYVLKTVIKPEDATDKSLTFKSSDSNVVTVDSNGKLTAKKAGSATITVKTNDGSNLSATVKVTVPNSTVLIKTLKLNKTSTTLDTGKSETLVASITPTNASNKKLTWTSSNTAIATVDQNGKVTAKKAGTTTITVKTNDGSNLSTTCKITVKDPVIKVKSLKLNKTTTTLDTGKTETLKATVSPDNATNKKLTWSSSNTNVATVDQNGKVTAKKAGTVTITVKTTDDSNISATCKVTVKDPVIKVKSIKLSKTSTTLDVGKTETLVASITPTNASNKKLTWSSSNTNVATVDQNGKVTAKKAGIVTITVKTNDGSNLSATCKVTVKDPVIKVKSLKVNPSSLTLQTGKSSSVKAIISPDNATDKKLTWSSSNTSVATVDQNGKVTAKKAGTATIVVKTANLTASCQVTVIDPAIKVKSLKVTPTTLTLDVGKSSSLKASVTPTNATNKKLTWSSSNTSIATVDQNGKVTAKKAGTTTITVKTNDGSNKSASVKVSVKKAVSKACSLNGKALNLTWEDEKNKSYWCENGTRQGTTKDPKGVKGNGVVRGREIYDPKTKAWYWLDANDNGAKAVNKEVWMPYVYQNEKAGSTSGKWVRYDSNGMMIKGWYIVKDKKLYPDQVGNTYYYDLETGAMAKGKVVIDGKIYEFDNITGAMK